MQAIFVQGYKYQTQVLLDGQAEVGFSRSELLDFEVQMNPNVSAGTFRIINQVGSPRLLLNSTGRRNRILHSTEVLLGFWCKQDCLVSHAQ